jgi:hypothetical protein
MVQGRDVEAELASARRVVNTVNYDWFSAGDVAAAEGGSAAPAAANGSPAAR